MYGKITFKNKEGDTVEAPITSYMNITNEKGALIFVQFSYQGEKYYSLSTKVKDDIFELEEVEQRMIMTETMMRFLCASAATYAPAVLGENFYEMQGDIELSASKDVAEYLKENNIV